MEDDHSHTRSSSQDSPLTTITTPEVASEDDDIWVSESHDDSSRPLGMHESQSDVLSDLPSVKRQHMTDGYREGLAVGKAQVMQQGFDAGYPIGAAIAMRAGKILGCIEGILAARDVSTDSKASMKKHLDQARQELAITALLKDMTDQEIMSFVEIPLSVQDVLSRWEHVVFGTSLSSGGDKVTQAGNST